MKKIRTVLLVDDDSINNFINERLIKKCKISEEVVVMLNGHDAILYLKENLKREEACPELILLDINMPVMDGFEFLAAFQKLNFANKSEVDIIMLTTSSNPNDIERLSNAMISGYLNKPLTEGMLIGVMEKKFQDPH
jgi:CheY-like chemotaxis protein